jgi:N-methylhydantoinase A
MDIRFVGQEHALTVPVPAPGGVVEGDPEPVAERFLDEYERTFGSILDEELEIVCVRAIATTPLEHTASAASSNGDQGSPSGGNGTVQAWSFTAGELTDFAVIERSQLGRDAEVEGPAIVREQTTTTYVDSGYRATVHPGGSLLIDRGGEA